MVVDGCWCIYDIISNICIFYTVYTYIFIITWCIITILHDCGWWYGRNSPSVVKHLPMIHRYCRLLMNIMVHTGGYCWLLTNVITKEIEGTTSRAWRRLLHMATPALPRRWPRKVGGPLDQHQWERSFGHHSGWEAQNEGDGCMVRRLRHGQSWYPDLQKI